jgi:hypothetical protein
MGYFDPLGGGGGMAYASVLKTDGREVLWVRPPPALFSPKQTGWRHTMPARFAERRRWDLNP